MRFEGLMMVFSNHNNHKVYKLILGSMSTSDVDS